MLLLDNSNTLTTARQSVDPQGHMLVGTSRSIGFLYIQLIKFSHIFHQPFFFFDEKVKKKNIYTYVYKYIFLYMYVNIYLYVCKYMFLCVCKYIYFYICIRGLSEKNDP